MANTHTLAEMPTTTSSALPAAKAGQAIHTHSRGHKVGLVASVAGATLLAVCSAASTGVAAEYCDQKGGEAIVEVTSKVDPLIADLSNAIDHLRKQGRDPGTIALRMPGGTFVPLPEILSKMKDTKAKGAAQVSTAVTDCKAQLHPAQQVVDGVTTLATGGLNLVFPERMFHVDVGQLLAGYPLGGSEAFIPKMREDLLAAIGLKNDNGEILHFLRDPKIILPWNWKW